MKKIIIRGGYYSHDHIILDPGDWSPEEWATILKLFGLKEAENIEISEYTVEAFGEKADSNG